MRGTPTYGGSCNFGLLLALYPHPGRGSKILALEIMCTSIVQIGNREKAETGDSRSPSGVSASGVESVQVDVWKGYPEGALISSGPHQNIGPARPGDPS